MKKLISFLLIAVLLLGSLAVTAFADSGGKLTPELLAKLDSATDTELIEVWVDASFTYGTPQEWDRLAEEETGIYPDELARVDTVNDLQNRARVMEQVNIYQRARRRIVVELRHQRVIEILTKAGIAYDDIVGSWDAEDILLGWSPHMLLTKEKINAITVVEEIVGIDLYNGQDRESGESPEPIEPPHEPEPWPYEPLDPPIPLGDADGDGQVTILDATLIQRFLAGLCGKEGWLLLTADADNDGELSVMDATRIQRILAGLCPVIAAEEINGPC